MSHDDAGLVRASLHDLAGAGPNCPVRRGLGLLRGLEWILFWVHGAG